LVPEPWNPHDSNAVAVAAGTNHVGYLPSEMAEIYAEPLLHLAKLSRLVTGQARIWALDEGGIVRARRAVVMRPVAYAAEKTQDRGVRIAAGACSPRGRRAPREAWLLTPLRKRHLLSLSLSLSLEPPYGACSLSPQQVSREDWASWMPSRAVERKQP
jgi:hypothetical protein